ncbi:MAG: hypothetical protein ABIG89_07220 [Candidatus Woesearchaeota archaeon]
MESKTSNMIKKIKKNNFVPDYIRNYAKDYVKSINVFRSYKWKILWILLIDISYLFLFYLIAALVVGSVMNTYIDDVLPFAEKVGQLKNMDMNNKYLDEMKKVSQELKDMFSSDDMISIIFKVSSRFIGKMLLGIFVLILFASAVKALIWSIIRSSFKRAHRFVLYNAIWIVMCLLFLVFGTILIKQDVMIRLSLFLFIAYSYLSTILKIRYNDEKPLFRQIWTNITFAVKYFIHYLPIYIAVITTSTIIIIIIYTLFHILLPNILPMAVGNLILSLIIYIALLIFINWGRIYMYEKTRKTA